MLLQLPSFWVGSDEQFLIHAEALARLSTSDALIELAGNPQQGQLIEAYSKYTEQKEEEGGDIGLLDYLADSITEIQGSVGIVRVEGTLVPNDSFYNLWFGNVSYNTISFALQRFAEDPEITDMVMSFATGGGYAVGLEQGATNLQQLRQMKPLHSFVDSAALSAGYWLAIEGESISAHKMAEVGSVGALIEHRSMFRLLKDHGIDAKIFRSGDQKALGHSSEQLTAEAEAKLQRKVETFRGFFVSAVMGRRPDAAAYSEKWIEGQEMFAGEGKDAGLVDQIVPFGQFLSDLNKAETQSTDPRAGGAQLNSNQEAVMARQIVIQNKAQRAALAGGATLEDTDQETGTEEEQAAATEAGTQETDETAGAEANAGEQGQEQDDTGAEVEAKTGNELVAFLREENAGLLAKIATHTATIEQQKLTLAGVQKNRDKFREITAQLLQHRQIALGQTPLDVSAMSDENMLQMYDTLEPVFREAYKIGAQSLSADETAAEDKTPEQQAASLGIYPQKGK